MRTIVTVNLPSGFRLRDAGEFEESKHPRGEGGQFATLSIKGGNPHGGHELKYDHGDKKWKAEGVSQARVDKLAVPAGYSKAHIAHDENEPLQVVGLDAKGRTQSKYSVAHAATQAAKKFERSGRLAKKALEIEAATKRDVVAGDHTAAAVRLMHLTGMRVGGDADTKAEKKAHGATSLLKSHVRVDGDTVHYDFTGKKGVRIQNSVMDKHLAEHVTGRLKRADGERLFQTDEGKANAYLKKVAGREFKAKDLRTVAANRLADREVKAMPAPKTSKEHVAARNKVADVVSSQLGNTRVVALKDYINPAVFSGWGDHHGGK